MKILMTGCYGMLAHDLMKKLRSQKHEIIETEYDTMDITILEQPLEQIHDVDLVIHAAAYTNVDAAEENYDTAYKINSLGARNVALGCQQENIPLLYISTDYVFGGGQKTTPYREHDPVAPLGAYGKTKYYGEQYIRSLLQKYYIVRTAWLYGINGPNFVSTMLSLAEENDTINVVNDQIGSPTYAVDLSEGISNIIQKPAYGTYHLTNSGVCSWYEFAKTIFETAEIDVTVKPVTSEEFARPAPRPPYSPLDNYNYRMEGHTPLPHYKDALQRYIKEAQK